MWWEAVDSHRVHRFWRGEITVVYPTASAGAQKARTIPWLVSSWPRASDNSQTPHGLSLPHSFPSQSATCQAWAASNGPLPTQSQPVITHHTATAGWAGSDTSDPLRGKVFFTFCYRVFVYVCPSVSEFAGHLSNYSVRSGFFVWSNSLFRYVFQKGGVCVGVCVCVLVYYLLGCLQSPPQCLLEAVILNLYQRPTVDDKFRLVF